MRPRSILLVHQSLQPPARALRWLRQIDPDPGSLLPAAYLMRVCHRIRDRFDLVIGSAQAELDLGGRGLLYIHHPDLGRFWRRYVDCGGKPLITKLRYLLTGRTRPWMALSDFSVERLKQSSVLTNSDWTGLQVEGIYGVRGQTLYPPVPAVPSGRPWNERENGFLASGRFHRRKRLDWIVRALGQVRRTQPGLTLNLVGTREPLDDGPRYFRELQDLAAANSAWVTLHEDLSRTDLSGLTGRLLYGIHAQVEEHFGIAPAEALLGGCIPFVHDSGGQAEIVDRDRRLCFSTEEDAVRKLSAVMRDGSLQTAILESLAPRELFTPDRFVEGLRNAVRQLAGSD